MGVTGNMKIHPFIFSWKGHYKRALALEKIFLEIFGRVTVINSDEENRPEHWINLTDEAYFAEQFSTACEHFDGDIMFHVQADVNYWDWNSVVEAAKTCYENHKFGVYSPNIEYTTCFPEKVNFNIILKKESKLRLVTITDCSAWFIDKEVINHFKEHYLESFRKNKYGWGVCWCISSIAYNKKMPVFRDYNFLLNHPQNTNYNTNKASYYGRIFLKTLIPEDLEFFIKLNSKHYYDIFEHLCTREGFSLALEAIPVDAEDKYK